MKRNQHRRPFVPLARLPNKFARRVVEVEEGRLKAGEFVRKRGAPNSRILASATVAETVAGRLVESEYWFHPTKGYRSIRA